MYHFAAEGSLCCSYNIFIFKFGRQSYLIVDFDISNFSCCVTELIFECIKSNVSKSPLFSPLYYITQHEVILLV